MGDSDNNNNNNSDRRDASGKGHTLLDLPHLFFILQGKRFEIIRLLRFGEHSFQELKEKLENIKYNYNIELHLGLLCDNGIVKKNHVENKKGIVYGLTNLGCHIHDLSYPLQYICKNQNVFEDHSVLDLPARFCFGIGVLNGAQIISGRPKTVRKTIDIYKQSGFIYNILYEVEGTDDVLNVLINKLKGNPNFHTKTIFGENSILDPERDIVLKVFEPFKRNGQISQKMMKIVKIGLVVTDKSAFVVFPKYGEGHPDTDMVIYGTNSEFRNWCLDYFNYCWNNETTELDWKKIKSNQN
jgi:predicted transcriptional regulator